MPWQALKDLSQALCTFLKRRRTRLFTSTPCFIGKPWQIQARFIFSLPKGVLGGTQTRQSRAMQAKVQPLSQFLPHFAPACRCRRQCGRHSPTTTGNNHRKLNPRAETCASCSRLPLFIAQSISSSAACASLAFCVWSDVQFRMLGLVSRTFARLSLFRELRNWLSCS